MNKILISGSFIIEPLRKTLTYWVHEIALECEVIFSPYNQVFQTLTMDASDHSHIVLIIRGKDLFNSEDNENFELLIKYLRNTSKTIFVIYCPDQEENPWGDRLKCEIDSMQGVHFIDLKEWLEHYSVTDFFDFNTELSAHVPYIPAVYTVLGTLVARLIYTMQSPIIKLIGVDCDNTLWRGVVAEEGITVHTHFQRWLRQLHCRGIAIALFSKNEIEDVEEVFENNTDMLLSKESIAAWCVNWSNKGENLAQLLKTLNIGSDSVLFLDDNPLECAAVSYIVPEAVVVEFEPTVFHHIWEIPIYHKATVEDLERTDMYKQHLEREDLKQTSHSFKEFIDSLDLKVQIHPISNDDIERVAQLTQRTNQFNASTRRRKGQEIDEFLQKKGASIYVVHAEDRFGNYGLVGAVFLEDSDIEVTVDTFLLSCRILGRGIEYQVVSFIGKLIRGKKVSIPYVQSKRNRPMKNFLDSLIPLQIDENQYSFDSEALALVSFDPDNALPSDALVSDIKPVKMIANDRSRIAKLTTSLRTAEDIHQKLRKSTLKTNDDPKTVVESLVIKGMEEVLNVNNIGLDDHFFTLGGDSFNAAVLASRLQELTNKSIDIIHIFDYPSAKTLAHEIQKLPHLINIEVKTAPDEIPPTLEQLAIRYGLRVNPEPSVYLIKLSYQIQGDLDAQKLFHCFAILEKRHDALQGYHTYSLNNLVENAWELSIQFHHIICDEQSITLYIQELSRLYHDPSQTLSKAGSYTQYSINQDRTISHQTLEFWKRNLPEKKVSSSLDRKADYYRIPISHELREKMLKFSKESDVTPFILLLTAFSIAMRDSSNDDELIVSIPFSTRKSDNIFGLFVNLLPVNLSINEKLSFRDQLDLCKKKVSEMTHYRFTPFICIQEELGTSVRMNIVFNWNRRIGQTPTFEGTEVTRLEVNSPFTEFNLSFTVEEEEDHYTIQVQYASSVYESQHIETLGKIFLDVLENCSEYENKLVEVWVKSLGENLKKKEGDFFQMGGDSLQAIRLMMEIEKKFSIAVSMKDLREHPTIAELTRFIETPQLSQEKQSVILIQTGGKETPIFLIHPSIGIAECYRSLSEYLPGVPMYGIQNPYVTHKSPIFQTLSEMAGYYAQEIKKVCPVGPYKLGGWSFGGNVALEVATILKKSGELIDFVILLDSYAPEAIVSEAPLLIASEDLIRESARNNKLLKTHRTTNFKGIVHLIRSSYSQLPDNGWNFLPNLSISEIPVPHHQMFDSEHIPKTAEALLQILPIGCNHQICEGTKSLKKGDTVINDFEQAAIMYPTSIAIRCGENLIDYLALLSRVNRLASYLSKDLSLLGRQPRIGILLPRSIDMVVSILATLKMGGIYVPLDPNFPQARLQYMMEDAQLDYLMEPESFKKDFDSSNFIEKEIFTNDSAYIIYTSGSTGRPKGVEITHQALHNVVTDFIERCPCNSQDRFLSIATISFDIFGLELFLPLMCGAELILCPAEICNSPVHLIKYVNEQRPSIMQATPTMWSLIAGHLQIIPTIICGGEPLTKTLATQLMRISSKLFNAYGPTETTIWSTISLIEDPDDTNIGLPIANTFCYVIDESLKPTPEGKIGELCIGGVGVAKGYWNQPELTEKSFFIDDDLPNGRYYRTRDLVRRNDDGKLVYIGRKDQQVKIRGNRIEMGEIQVALQGHPSIKDCVIHSFGEGIEKKLSAYYIVKEGLEKPTDMMLREYLGKILPSIMVPSIFFEMIEFPLTNNMKLDRNKLPEPIQQND